MIDASDLMKRLMRSPALPGGVKVTLSAIEGQYARFLMVFPVDKFRDSEAFQAFLIRASDNLVEGLLKSVRGEVLSIELHPSMRPFTVYVVAECLPKEALRASTASPSHFKFFNLVGDPKTFTSTPPIPPVQPGEPVGWRINNRSLEVYLPVESRAVSVEPSPDILSWIESQDPSFKHASSILRSSQSKGSSP